MLTSRYVPSFGFSVSPVSLGPSGGALRAHPCAQGTGGQGDKVNFLISLGPKETGETEKPKRHRGRFEHLFLSHLRGLKETLETQKPTQGLAPGQLTPARIGESR